MSIQEIRSSRHTQNYCQVPRHPSFSSITITIISVATCIFSTNAAQNSPALSCAKIGGCIVVLITGKEGIRRYVLTSSIQKLISFQKNQARQPKVQVRKFVDRYFNSIDSKIKFTSAVRNSPEVRNFLNKKILTIVRYEMVNEVFKRKIIQNVLNDFTSLFSDAERRINKDLHREELSDFGINVTDSVRTIRPLGDETHNQGKIPLLVVFRSGRRIVYKPRSMRPESLIVGRTNSVMEVMRWGTYKVLCCQEGGQHYGYAEFLEYTPGCNMIHNIGDLREYMRKMSILDYIASKLGVSDLHCQNIIVINKIPYIIDAEVFLAPSGTESGIFDVGSGAATVFDMTQEKIYRGGNKLNFSIHFPRREEFEYRMERETLNEIGVNIDQIRIQTHIQMAAMEGLNHRVKAIRNSLSEDIGRIVVIDTKDLKIGMLPYIDSPDTNKAGNVFIQRLQEKFKGQGFDLFLHKKNQITSALIQDGSHNDVPIFYYNSTDKTIVYNKIVIGERSIFLNFFKEQKKHLTAYQVRDLRTITERSGEEGELARDFGISRGMLRQYLKKFD